MTLAELLHYWLDNYARAHCKKWKAFQREFELYVSPLGDRSLESIRRGDVVSLQSELMRTKGKSAANAAVTLLSMLYNKAIDWELFEGKNPASRIRKFRIPARDRFMQPEELPRFLDALSELKNPTTRDYFLMLLFTGQRRRNTAEMKWSDIDWNRKVWQIVETKNGRPHTVPLVEQALEILRNRRGAHPVYVFPREDGTGPIWYRCTAWKYILDRAGITNLRIHDLRRTLASWQAITGSSLPIIAKTLGHLDTKSTQIYARLNLSPVEDSMKVAVTAMLGQATEPAHSAVREASRILSEAKILTAVINGRQSSEQIKQELHSDINDWQIILEGLMNRGVLEVYQRAEDSSGISYKVKGSKVEVSPIVAGASGHIVERVKRKVLENIDAGMHTRKSFWQRTSRETRLTADEMNALLVELERDGLIESFPISRTGRRLGYRRPGQIRQVVTGFDFPVGREEKSIVSKSSQTLQKG